MKKILLLSLLAIAFVGCSKQEKDTTKETIGKYVYIDSQDILHVESKCMRGMKTTDASGNSYYKPIERIETIYLTKEDIMTTCAWCVDDVQYDQLRNIVDKPKDEIIDYIPEGVYICTGGYASKYHFNPECNGLNGCNGYIVMITEEEAIQMNKTACKKCY